MAPTYCRHPELDPDRLANVTAMTHRYVDEGRFPNVVAAIVHHGEEVYRDTYGWADVADQRPVTENALFRIFSMTKPIASLALLQLYEQGRVLLEDPIGRYLPELAELAVVFLTQLVPSDSYPIRRQLRATVYGALV